MGVLTDILIRFIMGFVDLLILPWHLYQWWQLGSLKKRMAAFVLAGNASEFLFMVIAVMTIILVVGLWRHSFLVGTVSRLERFNGRIGQFAAWFALLMMIQQVLIIVMGQVFRGNELTFAPLGLQLTSVELQWMFGQLKFYNAVMIALGSAYTFIEGGHVRVDLIYAGVKYRTRKIMDLVGTLIFFLPSSVLLWWFAWPLAVNSIFKQRAVNIFSEKTSWRGFKWESSGTAEFTWVWAFKVLIVVFAGLLILQAFTFLLRNVRALREREEIDPHPRLDRHHDNLVLPDPGASPDTPAEAALAARAADSDIAGAAEPDDAAPAAPSV